MGRPWQKAAYTLPTNLFIFLHSIFLMLDIIAVIIIGFVASYIGAMVGSGGLLTIPFLIFLGLPAESAIATNRLAGVGLGIGSLYKYWKAGQVQWDYVFPLSLIALVGGALGSTILIAINKDILQQVVGVVLILLVPMLFINKEMGVKKFKPSTGKKIAGYILYTLAIAWGAFFGGGWGTMAFMVMTHFLGLTIIQASATNKIPGFAMSFVALVIFAYKGYINYTYGIWMLLGMLAGGYLGARTAVNKGNKWVKALFAVIVIISAIKLIS